MLLLPRMRTTPTNPCPALLVCHCIALRCAVCAQMHPVHDNWMLLMAKRPDCKTTDKAQAECPLDLWLTQVGG